MLGSLNVAANPTESLADSTSRVIDLDEVVVVSQPKENLRLRHLPLSSSVLTTKEMDNLNIRDLSQLSAYVPSFTMPAYGSRLTSSMYVRGIGSRIGSPAVGVYADNRPLVNKSAFNSHFYQIERVDVLRGPQGTLYGMNTEGGVVRMYSKNPMNNQGTDIRLGIGTGLYGNAELSHRFKLGDRLAFSVSAFYNGQKGFFENTNLGKASPLAESRITSSMVICLPVSGGVGPVARVVVVVSTVCRQSVLVGVDWVCTGSGREDSSTLPCCPIRLPRPTISSRQAATEPMPVRMGMREGR